MSGTPQASRDTGNPNSVGWVSVAVIGAVMVVCGIGAVISPALSDVAASAGLGALLALAGLVAVVQAMRSRSWEGLNWRLLQGAAEIVGGILIIFNPFKGAAAVTLLVAIMVGALGFMHAELALRVRPAKGWVWLFVTGVVSLLIGVALVLRFPFSLVDAPGAMAGLALIFGGVAYLAIGLVRKRLPADLRPDSRA